MKTKFVFFRFLFFKRDTFLAFSILIVCSNFLGCTQHLVKPDDDIQLQGESSVNLTNNETLYTRDTRIHSNGVSGIDVQTEKNIEIPREYVKSIVDVDHWRGARSGAVAGALVGLGLGFGLVGARPAAPDAGAELQFLFIPIGSGLGAAGGALVGGIVGHQNFYTYPETEADPARLSRLPPLDSFKSNFARSPFSLGADIGTGVGLFPVIARAKNPELKHALRPNATIAYHLGYALNSSSTIGLNLRANIAAYETFSNRSIDGQAGKWSTYSVRRNIVSPSLYYRREPSIRGWYYQADVGAALSLSSVEGVCCSGIANDPVVESYSKRGIAMTLESGYTYALTKHVHWNFGATLANSFYFPEYASVIDLGIGLKWL